MKEGQGLFYSHFMAYHMVVPGQGTLHNLAILSLPN